VTRVAICGGAELRSACDVLGLEPSVSGQRLVLVDLRVADAATEAAGFPSDIPRVVVATPEQAALLAALGGDRTLVASSSDAAVIGPLVARALPQTVPDRTRAVTLTAARGGTGRTLCAANLAIRLATDRTVLVIDATGTGTLGWWLGVDPRAWSELEALAGELRAEHVELVEGTAERLPFPDASFDALTFTYLLRYVSDPATTLRELADSAERPPPLPLGHERLRLVGARRG